MFLNPLDLNQIDVTENSALIKPAIKKYATLVNDGKLKSFVLQDNDQSVYITPLKEA